MRSPTPDEVERLQAAYSLVRAGRAHEARAAVAPIAANAPWISDAHHILGLALRALGEADAAEAAFADAVRAEPSRPEHRQEWAKALSERGHGLQAEGDLNGALAAYQTAADANPRSHAAEHHVAVVCARLKRHGEAAAAAERALAKGGAAPETFLVLGKAQQARGELDAAEAAYRQAVARRPAFVDAHGALAQLIWKRTSDLHAATLALDSAIAAHPEEAGLRVIRAGLFSHAGDARVTHAAAAGSTDLSAIVAGAEAALQFDAKAAVALARQALAQAEHPRMLNLLAQALLAAGQPEEAASVAASLLARRPRDQQAMALQATAWRLLDDTRYRALYDYGLAAEAIIAAPSGWSDLPAYLADLTRSLAGLPQGADGRSASLLASGDRAIRAFLQAIDGPIRDYIEGLGDGADPLRARRKGGYKLAGVWAARTAGQDEVRADGWISGVCFVSLAGEAPASPLREGWLRLGQPGVRTTPSLEAEHLIAPQPGLLALFPAYMWHGVTPSAAAEPPLTIAFDLSPA